MHRELRVGSVRARVPPASALERRRALATALQLLDESRESIKTRALAADEPTGNLDSDSGEQVFRLLRDINVRDHTTFIVVTHDERLAERCDRVVRLVDGRLARDTINQMR